MKGFLLLVILMLSACGKHDPDAFVNNRTIKEILNCVDATYDSIGRCRVSFENGERATVHAPVAVGDIMECVYSNIYKSGKRCRLK